MAFWTLYKRELNSYFQSAVAYVVLFGSALIQGMFFIILVSFIWTANYKDQSVMQIFFTWPLFWLFFLVQVPLITMRVFSEEFKLGTIEMLLTAPGARMGRRPRQVFRRAHLLPDSLAAHRARSDRAPAFFQSAAARFLGPVRHRPP